MNNKAKKKSKIKFLIWFLVIATVSLILLRPMLGSRNTAGEEIIPKTGDITTYYSFSGAVEAKNRQNIFAERAIQIKDIKVEEGQLVSKDDVLMTTTFGEKILAKIDGEVSIIHAEENEQLMPGAKLIDIVDYSDLQISVKVDEYDLAAISNGKDAVVTIHALSKDIKGTIQEVSKEGTNMNGITFFTATIALEKDADVKVGMSAEAKVLDKSVQNVLMLPVSAISFDASNKPYAAVKADKGIRIAELEIGLTDGINAEILSGITKTDIVVIEKAEESGFRPPFRRDRNQDDDNDSEEN